MSASGRDDGTGGPEPLSRRDALRRATILGGALVWSVPVVQSIGMRAAHAIPSPPPGETNLSFVALHLVDATDTMHYRIKWEVGATALDEPPECGRKFAVDSCTERLEEDDPHITHPDCPPGVSAVLNPDGSVTVDLGSLTLTKFVVKCPDCTDPGDAGQPAVPATGFITFPQCS